MSFQRAKCGVCTGRNGSPVRGYIDWAISAPSYMPAYMNDFYILQHKKTLMLPGLCQIRSEQIALPNAIILKED